MIFDYFDNALYTPLIFIIVALLCILLVTCSSAKNVNKTKYGFPVARMTHKTTTDSLMAARAQYPDTPFVLPMKEPWIILPHCLVEEVKAVPQSVLSFDKLNEERLFTKQTMFPSSWLPQGVAAVQIDLTKNTANMLSMLHDEARGALDDILGPAEEFKKLKVYDSMLQIVARLSAKIFVGEPLCRDKDWLDASIRITTDTVAAFTIIRYTPRWLRPFVVPLIPQIRNIKAHRQLFIDKMKPRVQALGDIIASGASLSSAAEQDLTSWTMARFRALSQINHHDLAIFQVGISIAAIHTTSMALAFVLFDLAAHPEYITELRKEIADVLGNECGDSRPAQVTKQNIGQLRKLDSFMKESQRMNPPVMIQMTRMVMPKDGYTLSTGHKLPRGSYIGFGAPYYNTSTIPTDTLLNERSPSLGDFYPWRYSELRELPGQENKHQFVTTDNNEISFGTGKHACPGRFFASYEMKVVLVEFVRRYHIGLGPHGEGVGEKYAKPGLIEIDMHYAPNPWATVWIKQRSGDDASA